MADFGMEMPANRVGLFCVLTMSFLSFLILLVKMNNSIGSALSGANHTSIMTELENNMTGDNGTGSVLTEQDRSLISDSTQFYLNIYFISVTLTLISAFGVVTNIINSAVFLKQGIRDCVSLSLFALTISDFGTVFCALVFSLCFATNTIDRTLTFDPYSFQAIIRWPRSMFFMISMGITAFISVERCLCVVLPFRFRSLFTVRRTAAVVISIFFLFIITYSPIYATYGLAWRFDPRTNSSRILVWLADNRAEIEMYCNLFNQISLLTICQIVIVVCTVAMVSGLKFSKRFREQKSLKKTKILATAPSSEKLDKREARVIKMVSILTTICMACTLVQLAVVYARRLVVEISLTGIYGNLYNNLASSALISGALNSSLNIFVYYNLKPKFKETFLEMFCCQRQKLSVGESKVNIRTIS